MNLAIAWALFPLLFAAMCGGCGLAAERLSGTRIPGALVPLVGYAAIVVVAQVLTLWDSTASLATPAAVAGTLAGLALSRAWWRRLEPWAIAVAAGVFAAYAAPIVLSGQATFAGYIRLDDTATWMALTDRVMDHGRSLSGLAPSTYEATLAFNLGSGYPVGVFLPLGIGRDLVGQDVAWVIQPYMASCAAGVALALWQLAGPVVRSRAVRAFVTFLAAQSALLVGYYLWGGIKEVAGAALLAAAAGLVGTAIRARLGLRALIPLALTCSALIGVLSGGGGIWLAGLLLAALPAAVRSIGARRTLVGAAGLIALTALGCVPVLAPGGLLPPTSSSISSATALGNLLHPLSGLQVFGIWPAGDFRLDPVDPGAAYALIAATGVAGIWGLGVAWRRRASTLLIYVSGVLAACGVIVLIGSPWIAGKAMAMASPAILLLAGTGAAVLWTGRGDRTRLIERGAGAALLAAIGVGVLWSGALAYRDVNLAPRDQLAELETIGHRIAGQGPTLMTEYQPYGVRHFLRDSEPEGASELRRRQVRLLGGGTLSKGTTADTDRFRLAGLLVYRTLVLRRSPTQSRPPSPYRLTWRGRYYEVWQRPEGLESSVIDHLGLGSAKDPTGVPKCSDVARLAHEASPLGTLVAARRAPVEAVPLKRTTHPSAWRWAGYPRTLLPLGAGTITSRVRVPRAGRYEVWLGGSVRPRVDLFVDGRQVGQVRHQLNNAGEFVLLGKARLHAGDHELAIQFGGSDLHPGSGGAPSPIGPLELSAADPASDRLTRVPANRGSSLCGRRLDWIEALAPGGVGGD